MVYLIGLGVGFVVIAMFIFVKMIIDIRRATHLEGVAKTNFFNRMIVLNSFGVGFGLIGISCVTVALIFR